MLNVNLPDQEEKDLDIELQQLEQEARKKEKRVKISRLKKYIQTGKYQEEYTL